MDEDSIRFANIVRGCSETSAEVLDNVEKFVSALKRGDKNRKGISLLEVKNREMLAYMTELSLLMGQMSCGKSILDDPTVFRAIKHRTVLERMRPIEEKMRTQIDRLMQDSENSESKEPMRARPEQMELEDGSGSEKSDEDEEEEEEKKKSKKYVPPKIMPVYYNEDEGSKESKALEKVKKRALQSSLIQELKQQYSEAPEEYRELNQRKYEADKERQVYEEDNFVRLRMTKAEKNRDRRMTRDNAIDDLLNFGNYMMRDEDGEALVRKRKASSGGKPKNKRNKIEKKKINRARSKSKNKAIKKRQ